MKIALVCFRMGSPLSRVSLYSSELAAQLRRENIDVTRLASDSTGQADVALLRSTSDWNFTTKVSLRMSAFVQHEGVDLVHVIGGFPESGILTKIQVPVVYEFFGGSLFRSKLKPSIIQKLRGLSGKARSSWMMNRTIKNTGHFIVHSDQALEALIEQYPVNRSSVSVIPMATNEISYQGNVGALKGEPGVLILCDSASKVGLLRALNDMSRMHTDNGKLQFTILCDYSSYFAVFRAVKKQGMDAFVRCIECRADEDFTRECLQSDLMVVPQTFLSRDRLIAEARVIGRPVAHFVSSTLEIVTDLLDTDIIVSRLSQGADHFEAVMMGRGTVGREEDIYPWQPALCAVSNMYSDLIDQWK